MSGAHVKKLIVGAHVVTPTEIVQANVLIDGDRIASIDAPRATAADEIVEAHGLHLLPGVIDDQVHFRDPGLTWKEDLHTGSLGCARGGITTFLEMPNTVPNTTSQAALTQKLALAAQKSVVNYGFYIGATPTNASELATATRTPGIKIFIGSSTGDLLVDEQAALEEIFANGTLPITAHCEDEETIRRNRERIGATSDVRDHSRIRDHEAAVVATKRALELAHRHDRRFHLLHMSTADEIDLIRDHRGRITGEVCPHHLFFTVDDYERLGTKVQMNPSVKTRADAAALWDALVEGTIQVVATDHAPHTLEEKVRSYPSSPSGVPAVENLLALMLDRVASGDWTLLQLVDRMCDAPARTWDIIDKGRIAEGYEADLVLVDLSLERTIDDAHQVTRCGWSPWHGETLRGWPVRTWVMGREVFRDGVIDEAARGREARFDHARGGYHATAGAALPASERSR